MQLYEYDTSDWSSLNSSLRKRIDVGVDTRLLFKYNNLLRFKYIFMIIRKTLKRQNYTRSHISVLKYDEMVVQNKLLVTIIKMIAALA